LPAFLQFRKSISLTEWAVHFWSHFLEHSIETHWARDRPDHPAFQAMFAAFNLPQEGHEGWLWSDPNNHLHIRNADLEDYRRRFFAMVKSLALVRSYNALEILLFQAVLWAYFPSEKLISGKNATRKGEELIKKAFREGMVNGKMDSTNNRHLLAFIAQKSAAFDIFFSQKIRSDMHTTWSGFFEFISIIRNINTHQGGLLTQDTLNQLKSASKELFERAFDYEEEGEDHFALLPMEGDNFVLLIALIKDFAVNASKHIFDQADLAFLGLQKC